MGAAMLGGVGGHAGLFSNSMDVAILMQMLLNNGTYGGKRFFNGETIQLFTQRPEENKRRSLGFDMKDLTRATPVNMSDLAPNETFGHMGFTGTAVWADPVHNIVFVFLCNRTYPNIENQKLNKLKTRQKVQDQIYMALKKYASSHA